MREFRPFFKAYPSTLKRWNHPTMTSNVLAPSTCSTAKARTARVFLPASVTRQSRMPRGGIGSVKMNSHTEARYTRKAATNGQPYETYSSTTARDNGIERVEKNAPTAPTVDNTYQRRPVLAGRSTRQ